MIFFSEYLRNCGESLQLYKGVKSKARKWYCFIFISEVMNNGYIDYNFNNLSCLDSFVLQVVCKRAGSLLAFSDEELQKVRLELDNMRAERDRLQEILKMAGR